MNEEATNKKNLINITILEIVVIVFYLFLVLITYFILKEGCLLNIIIISSTIFLIIICFLMIKREISIGYCECKKCKHRYIPTFTKAFMALHAGTTRYMKCPKCGEYSWSKKVLTK